MPLILSSLVLFVLSGIGALIINSSAFHPMGRKADEPCEAKRESSLAKQGHIQKGTTGSARGASSPSKATRIGVTGNVLACLLGAAGVIQYFLHGQVLWLSFPLNIPYGNFAVSVDGLSAFFLIPIFILCPLAAIYGAGYLCPWHGRKPVGMSWFFFNLLSASMVLVVISRNAVLFLMAWEIMTAASFFLVTFEDEKPNVQKSGLQYMIAAQLGSAFILVLFMLLGKETGSLDFNRFHTPPGVLPSVIFVLALFGFGTKAGFIPFHVWLPEAHPAAPSHVSAVMSGVMIKTGIYGLVRVLTFLGPPPLWWGLVLIAIGITSGILGVILAIAQHDLKRLLAYHSVENIGIIALGLGTGVLGMSIHSPVLTVLGFGGGLLHVINHALFKGLLFMGAGAVLHGTGTKDLDCLGGLMKRMPVTATCFLVGSAAICGLPPLNGFVSEFMIYLGGFYGIRESLPACLFLIGGIAALAMIGALAGACFTKAFGIVFLGQPRSARAQNAHEPGLLMRLPMVVLSLCCLFIGIAAPLIVNVFIRVVPSVTGLQGADVQMNLRTVIGPLTFITLGGLGFFALLGLFFIIRKKCLQGRTVEQTVTWDCGHAAPSPRMQYTASSFAQPLTDFFSAFLRTRRQEELPQGIFPRQGSFSSHAPDIFEHDFYRPLFEKIYLYALRMHFFQHGRLQLYIMYIMFTLLAVLVWKLW